MDMGRQRESGEEIKIQVTVTGGLAITGMKLYGLFTGSIEMSLQVW